MLRPTNGRNTFLRPLVIGQDQHASTAQVALSSYPTAPTVTIRLIYMTAAVSILPLALVFVFLRRRWSRKTQTGIKG